MVDHRCRVEQHEVGERTGGDTRRRSLIHRGEESASRFGAHRAVETARNSASTRRRSKRSAASTATSRGARGSSITTTGDRSKATSVHGPPPSHVQHVAGQRSRSRRSYGPRCSARTASLGCSCTISVAPPCGTSCVRACPTASRCNSPGTRRGACSSGTTSRTRRISARALRSSPRTSRRSSPARRGGKGEARPLEGCKSMTRAGLEPATYGLKVRCSTN
jgi:hypothetical protein